MIQNPIQMMQRFNQFRRDFNGDPKTTVENLLSTGQMSKEQFEQLKQMANEFSKFIK